MREKYLLWLIFSTVSKKSVFDRDERKLLFLCLVLRNETVFASESYTAGESHSII